MMRAALPLALMAAPPLGAETLRIGANPAYPPYLSTDAQGRWIGLDADLAREICERGNYQCQWVPLGFDEVLPALIAGEIDVVMGGIGYSTARDAMVDFTCPYFATDDPDAELYTVSPDTPLETLRVAVIVNSLQELVMQQAGFETVPFASQEAAVAALQTGQADGLFGYLDAQTASNFVLRKSFPLPTTGAAIAVSEDRPDLLAALDGHLAAVSADGQLAVLQELWLGTNQGDIIATCQKPTPIS